MWSHLTDDGHRLTAINELLQLTIVYWSVYGAWRARWLDGTSRHVFAPSGSGCVSLE
jgi:hypothetical protein